MGIFSANYAGSEICLPCEVARDGRFLAHPELTEAATLPMEKASEPGGQATTTITI